MAHRNIASLELTDEMDNSIDINCFYNLNFIYLCGNSRISGIPTTYES